MKKWYQELYENFDTYNDEPYVQNTSAEVDFIEEFISHHQSSSILDIGCGTGRHSLELARRGHKVVGVDLSPSLLAQGRQAAEAEGLTVDFRQADARTLSYSSEFNTAIMLCEGAFSLMEEDRMDHLILENAYRALRPGGKLIMTVPNAAFMIFNEMSDSFNLATCRESFTINKILRDGSEKELSCTQRYYIYPELSLLLGLAGFRTIECFSCSDEGYGRDQKPTKMHYEFGAVAEK